MKQSLILGFSAGIFGTVITILFFKRELFSLATIKYSAKLWKVVNED